jgi:hypothetical protein
MKLTQEEIHRIVKRLAKEWKGQQLIYPKTTDHLLVEKLNEIFIKELRIEDDLNKEVEQLLEKYEKQFQSGALDRRKMYNMVKAQLVKERKIVL